MKGQSFINFLREEDGKADRQKVLSISALVGSSVLAQLTFIGTATAGGNPCNTQIDCCRESISRCLMHGCDPVCGPDPCVTGSCVSG